MIRFLITLITFILLAFGICWPTIINIPDDWPTIQYGIDASTEGDTVLVQPGTYIENINFNGHNIVLGSLFLTTGDTSYISQTIIDGDSAWTAVIFENGEDSTAVIMGFKIQHGVAYRIVGESIKGGGIHCQNSNPRIIYNKITENYPLNGIGAGIFCRSSSPLIANNLIFSNIPPGISCRDGASPRIIQNTISLNFEGIACYQSNPVIKNTIICYNGRKEIRGYPMVSYSAVRGGWPGVGNLDVNPLFLDPYNYNFNICEQSQCINSGDPNILDPDGTRSDIGFYYPEHPECSTGNFYYVSVNGNDTTGDGSLSNPFRTIQHSVDVSYLEDTVLVLPGIYNENIFIGAKNLTLASNFIFSADTLDIINTVLVGNSSGSLLKMRHCDSLSEIIGMTFTNGNPVLNIGYCENTEIKNDLFEQNDYPTTGAIIFTRYNSQINITENTFRYNSGVSIIESNDYMNALVIRGNKFHDNSNIYVLFSGTHGTVFENNVIHSNIGLIFYCWMIAGPSIFRHNLIYNNHCPWATAGGIFITEDSNLLVENNIFYGNSGVNQTYFGYFFIEHSNPGPINFNNNIIWDNYYPNPENTFMLIEDVDFHLTYSDVQGGWPGVGNINVDPLFRDPANGDYHLMSTACGDPYDSPCIDVGDPYIIDSLLDCMWGLGGLRSDIGAYAGGDSLLTAILEEYNLTPNRFMLLQNYPNPFNARTKIAFNLPYDSNVKITVYDILGRHTRDLINDVYQSGKHIVEWDGRDNTGNEVASGFYFYTFEADEFTAVKKMLMLK